MCHCVTCLVLQVHRLQKELEALQPVLATSQKDTADLMDVIQKRLPGVEETRAVVKRDADIANAEAEKVAATKQECEDDLSVAMPILEAALKVCVLMTSRRRACSNTLSVACFAVLCFDACRLCFPLLLPVRRWIRCRPRTSRTSSR